MQVIGKTYLTITSINGFLYFYHKYIHFNIPMDMYTYLQFYSKVICIKLVI